MAGRRKYVGKSADAPASIFLCQSCERNVLAYPFVHQGCQHVVCSSCAYGNRDDLYCKFCRSETFRLGLIKTKEGQCTRAAQLIEWAATQKKRNTIKRHRERIRDDQPLHYALAMRARPENPINLAKRKVGTAVTDGLGGCFGWILYLLCCCNLPCCVTSNTCRGIKWMGWSSAWIIKIMLLFLISVTIMLAMVWPINYLVTGNTTFNNLAVLFDVDLYTGEFVGSEAGL